MPPTSPLLPVSLLSGVLGAGKTTLLNQVLNDREGRRGAVIANDMNEVNIDADLVRDGGANLSRTDEMLIEMTNGCIPWSRRWGDRRQELVFIGGPDRGEAAIRVGLDASLADSVTTGPTKAQKRLDDLFPVWGV
ncbi:cobalamin synthesis protein P47K [Methylobacterium nodulans ORS 2060]|uniref:Cobalamin synthesis protein P47K n=1 Tax=Methylobacterium nodulans (strain LMG 21967 / CNCM I-2342 / ORS 2060) TaxID=460265 RepID=B8ILX4_METNO|nr:cobalamin synthesis protein P47K [Methylobacterium nodulans ORS 2060]